MLLAFGGSVIAQEQDWQGFNPNGYESHWADYTLDSFLEVPDWIVAFVQIDGEYVGIDDNWQDLEIAAFVNGELRGNGFMTDEYYYDEPEWQIPYPLFDFYVWYNTETTGETVDFKLYDHSSGTEYTDFSINVEITTGSGDHIDIYHYNYDAGVIFSFTTPEQTIVPQTIALVEGVNWISFNVEITLDDLKAALVEAVTGDIQIKGKNGSTTYTASTGNWRGQLSSLGMSQMYKVDVSSAGELVLEGMPVDPAEHPVTILGSANGDAASWIAFPLNEAMSVTNAFAGFAAINQEQVKSKDASTTYNGTRWRGQLNNLEPGKGYIYISKSSEDRPFTFPTSK